VSFSVFVFFRSRKRKRAKKKDHSQLLPPLTPSHVLRARVLRRRLQVGAVGLDPPRLRGHRHDLGRRRVRGHAGVGRGLPPPREKACGSFEPGDLVPHDVEPVVAHDASRVARVLVPAPVVGLGWVGVRWSGGEEKKESEFFFEVLVFLSTTPKNRKPKTEKTQNSQNHSSSSATNTTTTLPEKHVRHLVVLCVVGLHVPGEILQHRQV
jgi:hypothetical protein